MDIINVVLNEVSSVLKQVDQDNLSRITNYFNKNTRIFVDGEGRSGLIGKTFAMRLMHIGYNSYVVGETISPSIKDGDLYVSISGSGETKFVIENTKKAKEIGCSIISVTSRRESTLGLLGNEIIFVPGTTKNDDGKARKSIQLLGSLFDQSVHIVLDCICLLLSIRDDVSNDDAKKMHSNLE